jgi:histone arginine demethylase JMJD6
MKYYTEYLKGEALIDDSPLYIFDEEFGEDDDSQGLLSDYAVPPYFEQDLFSFTGERRRPPYRWIVIGPARSGTGIHVDPLGTSAWNALIYGRKRWVLFPPQTPRHLIGASGSAYSAEGISWFHDVLPGIQQKHDGEHVVMYDFVQEAGETVFVPGGWWHVVVNLTMSAAVTHNFCSSVNLERVWLKLRQSRPRLARRLMVELNRRGYRDEVNSIRSLRMVPDEAPESSDSDSSSSSEDSVNDEDDVQLSDTDSETDTESRCRCRKCKMKHKRKIARIALGLPAKKIIRVYSP